MLRRDLPDVDIGGKTHRVAFLNRETKPININDRIPPTFLLFATADLIRSMTTGDTAAELPDRMRHLREAGYAEVVVQVTPGSENLVEDCTRVFSTVQVGKSAKLERWI